MKTLNDKAHEVNLTSVTEDQYWNMLEAVPPAYQSRNGFVCGEPMTHVEGEPVYECFIENSLGIFVKFLGTVEYYKKVTAFLCGK